MSIELHPAQHRVSAAQLPLEKLAGNNQLSPDEKLTEVSRQFEAILLRQIFTEAQKPVFQSKFSNSSTTGGIYQDLITKELADQVSRSGSLGLGRSLEGQLKQQLSAEDKPATDQGTGSKTEPARNSGSAKRV